MGRLSIDQLKPGMVTGEDVLGTHDRMLLGKGVELTEKHLRVLKMWGIIDVEIEGETAQDAGPYTSVAVDSAILEEAVEQTKLRFRFCDLDHTGVHELFRLCVLRAATGISRGEVGCRAMLLRDTAASTDMKERRVKLPWVNALDFLQNGIKLPSLPAIFMQIQDVINNPSSSSHSIADVIGKDTGLAARLLKLVNSTLYGFPAKIDSLSRAVTVVGTKQLSTLALGVTIVSIFKDIPHDLIDLKSFWKHSVACGIIARTLAKYKNISNNERVFVGGLLHDIGRMIIYGYLPEHAREALLTASRNSSPLQTLELEIMGFTHQTMGTMLLKEWRLPLTLENMVRYHHNPMRSKQPMDSAIVHIADLMVNALDIGSSGELFVPALDPHAWEILGASSSILGPMITQIDGQINEIIEFFCADE